jgi:hypothetical protein
MNNYLTLWVIIQFYFTAIPGICGSQFWDMSASPKEGDREAQVP